MAPKKSSPSKSPVKAKPAPSPVGGRRSTPRKSAGMGPTRLGVDDGFGVVPTAKWATPKSEVKEPPKAGKALLDDPEEYADEKPSVFKVVGPSDVLVMSAATYGFYYALPKPVPTVMPPMTPALMGMAAAVVSSYLLYAIVWYKSKAFKAAAKKKPLSLLGKNAVIVFEKLVLGTKTMQQLALLAWATPSMEFSALQTLVMTHSQETFAIAAGLLLVGQILNASIYKAIGRDGVYYGFKLGRSVAWSSAFPFNAGFRHPQYVGGMTSQLGVLVLLSSPATISAGLVPLAGLWGFCYIVTSIFEASGDNNK